MDLFSSLPGSKPLNQQKKSPSLTELLSGINLPASMGAEKEFVVENAPASCKFGTDISFIPASGGEVKIGSQLFLTKGNKKIEAPYFGTCLKQTADKKKEGKEEAVDCVPDCEPYEWTNLEEATTVSGEATLTVRSKLSCLHAGVPETINILDSGQGTDGKEMMEKLLEYDIYAKIVYDMDGNPQIFWSLEQDGRGVYNPEMSRYLKKVAPYLNFNIVNFISNDDWIEKINEATRNGYDYTTGKDYNWFVKWTGIASIYVLDGYEFFTQTELGIALMTLGFAYADYRLAYNQPKNFNGNKKASGANQKVVEEITNPVLEAPRSGSGLKVDDIKPVKGKGSVYDIDLLTGKPPTKQTQIIIDEFPNVPKAHGFSDIIDNYAGLAEVTDLGNAKLYQIQGSQNGVMGRFEWIIQDGKVTHRMFVRNPELNGVPIK
ncbi:PAAR-like protein [Enterococcus sp. CWB-B31]|uniref:PAAR-like protein n=1 Tax=Enterococcus sp. CWB-B31 TaxID=2885159 RepID=UPI001E39EB2D|nr:PAAR-like protein [Enterococcus sp. CWB-B31]MCB5954255.1 DUF4280 domain-containing protein [Enterococcus sp. CWB-B31]